MHKQEEIVNWAMDRRIIQESNPVAQSTKTVEEANEMLEAIELGDIDHFKLEAGDVYVTLVLAAEMAGVSLKDCIDDAYNKIKDRKGMMLQGRFVKEFDIDQLYLMGFALHRDSMQMTCSSEEQRNGAVVLLETFGLASVVKFYSESMTWLVAA